MTTIEKIKAEIERLKSIEYPCDNSQQATGFFNALDRMTDFLDTIESEKPIIPDGLDEEVHRFFDECIEVHEVPLYGKVKENVITADCYEITARHFAKWQYQKDRGEFAQIKAKTWSEGFDACKEQMMKEAIHYVVQDDLDTHGASYNIPFIRIGIAALKPKGIGVGDKVRIIIVKED